MKIKKHFFTSLLAIQCHLDKLFSDENGISHFTNL